MSGSRCDLVSVVVPAFNAAGTLDETLLSARHQTYPNIEIIVVNDGSTDQTPDIAERHALEDKRVRLITIARGGVAAARNTGISTSSGTVIAPLDADDLWHPQKLERQMQVMRDGGPETGFVYTFHRRIDAQNRIIDSSEDMAFEGRVYLQLLLHNFVSNGSSPLFRREAVQEFGGYEEDLFWRGAQGCEDYLLQLLIARKWMVRCVPEYLVGYRMTKGSMSTNWRQMLESQLLVLDHVSRRHPELPRQHLAAPEALCRTKLAILNLKRINFPRAGREFRSALSLDAAMVAETMSVTIRFIIHSRVRRLLCAYPWACSGHRSFVEAAPTEIIGSSTRPPYRQRLETIARREPLIAAE